MPLPPVLTREQVRQIDRRAIEEFGIPSFTLMENAARACADEAERMLRAHGVQRAMNKIAQPGSRDDIPRTMEELDRWKSDLSFAEDPTVVLCGPGNNGGDGLALARTLHNRGHAVTVVVAAAPGWRDVASPDVQLNLRLLAAVGVPVWELSVPAQTADLRPHLAKTKLIVDALFGTGLSRTLGEPYLTLIEMANESAASRLAVDIPSGLDADTGDVLGAAFRADLTVTFVGIKPGFLCKVGPACCGKVRVAEIGIPRHLIPQ